MKKSTQVHHIAQWIKQIKNLYAILRIYQNNYFLEIKELLFVTKSIFTSSKVLKSFAINKGTGTT